jgi:alpha-N-arabinofuranosidase
MHFYSRGKSRATQFTVDHLQEQLSTFADLESAILQQHALLRSFDPKGEIGLLIDEWGVWDLMDPEEEKRYGRLWQQITMRSAVAAALGLNVFHRQADKLVMGNIAQIVNVLHSLLLTEGDRCIRTSTYYAFELLKPHRAKDSLRIENEDREPLGLSASASRKDRNLAVTWVNPRHDEAMDVDCALAGAAATSGSARILHHRDFNACNTFENPEVIVPKDHKIEVSGSRLRVELPPLAIVTAAVNLA